LEKGHSKLKKKKTAFLTWNDKMLLFQLVYSISSIKKPMECNWQQLVNYCNSAELLHLESSYCIT